MITINKKDYKIIDVHTHLPWQDEYKTIKEKEQCLIEELKKNKIDSAVLIADSLSESCIYWKQPRMFRCSNEKNESKDGLWFYTIRKI